MVQNDKPIVKFLNIMVLLSSILVLVIISIELLSATTILSERFIQWSVRFSWQISLSAGILVRKDGIFWVIISFYY